MDEYIQKNLKTYSMISASERLKLSNRMSILCGIFLFIFDIIRVGVTNNLSMKVMVLVSSGVVILQFELIKKGYLKSSFVSFVIGETYNLILIYMSYFHYPKYSVLWGQISTCVFFYYQGFLSSSLKTCFLLSLKHSGLWIFIGVYNQKLDTQTISTLVVVIFYLFITLVQTMHYETQVTVKILKSNYEVKLANEKIVSILESLQDFLFVVSTEGKELYTNSSARSFLGLNILKDKLEGFTYSKTYKNRFFENEKISSDIQKTLELPVNTCIQYGVIINEGQHIEWSGKLINWDDKKALILTGRIITKIIELEKENRANSYRSALINTVSHELRTPANAIMAISNLLLESHELSSDNESKVKIILGSCSFQLCLINDLLDYAQIVSGCLKVSKISFSLFSLIDECISYIKPQLNSNVVLETILNNTPDSIISDPNRLKQIILNLINNARKFTLKGKILLEISFKSSSLKVSCSDTGIGIPSSKIPFLFTEFSKIEESSCYNLQGVGLGLVISNQLVKALGGIGIEVKSQVALGSSFEFEIQAEEYFNSNTDVAVEGSHACVPAMMVKSIHSKIEILVVDDVYFNIIAVLEMLKGTGIKCRYALNGEEALEVLEKVEFSCVLMDLEMPILDGWETVKRIRKRFGDLGKGIPPIIACTAYCSLEIQDKCKEAGMCDIVEKPCRKEELINSVNFWILRGKENDRIKTLL